MSSVKFIVGNTYTQLPISRAEWDKTGTHRKIHDWTLYVDILSTSSNGADLVKMVEFNLGASFEPPKFIFHCPVKTSTTAGTGESRWRFQTRQSTYGQSNAEIIIIGRGGTKIQREFRVRCSEGGTECDVDTFIEHYPYRTLTLVPMANVEFGVGLQSSPNVSYSISNDALNEFINMINVSPSILRGETGLREVQHVMLALGSVPILKADSSLGIHVRVKVDELSLAQLKNVCQNFIKYESAMDLFMHPYRLANKHCRSNKLAVAKNIISHTTDAQYLHEKIAACTSVLELRNLVSPSEHYKLHLEYLLYEHQSTFVFRQHPSSYQRDKVANWIRFCVAFVHNSAKFRPPSYLTRTVSEGELFDMMMMYAVKDRYLRDVYRGQIQQQRLQEQQEQARQREEARRREQARQQQQKQQEDERHRQQQEQQKQQHRQQQHQDQQQQQMPTSTANNIQEHYQILGILRTASASEIKRAFHKMALKYHPDKNSAEDAAEMFRRVKLAYEVLGRE
ncbi:hypothetical protein ACHAXH_004792 [Discostella pseudostelligera]